MWGRWVHVGEDAGLGHPPAERRGSAQEAALARTLGDGISGLRGLWGHEELAAYGNRQPCLRSKCGDPEGFLGVQIPGALR